MTAFELAAKLKLDSSSFDQGLAKGESKFAKFGQSIKNGISTVAKVGAAGFAAISAAAIKLAGDVASAGNTIDKQSQVLGMSRKAYQEWDYILSQNGASIDSMSVSMKTLNSTILSAKEGTEEAKTAFAKLGLGIHEIENLSMEQQFEAVVRAFQKMPAGAEKSALAVKLFGRNGMELLPLLNNSATSIDEMRAKAEELGIIMSDDAVNASVEYTDALDTMQRTFNGLKYSIGAKVLPVLTAGMSKITDYAGRLKKAYDKNGFKGVWDELVTSFKSIKWPTWDDVKNAAIGAWNTILAGARELGGLIFGTKGDGSVDWPDWSDVEKFASEKWEAIKAGARELAGLVFGTKSDGSVDWPTWNEVKGKAGEIWEGIKGKALTIADSLGGLVFGRKEDGSVDWPEVTTLQDGLNALWEKLKEKALNIADTLGGLVFGRAEDGTVNWPDPDTLLADFQTWWTNTALPKLESAMVWTLKLFGMPTESAEEIASVVSGWWDTVVGTVEGILNWALHLPDSPHEAGEKLREVISGWWEGIKSYAEGVLNWTLGLFGIGDSDGTQTNQKIKEWWDSNVVPLLADATRFVLGLFGLPDAGQMVSDILTWWAGVKESVGALFLDIIPRILGIGGGSSEYEGWEGDSKYNSQGTTILDLGHNAKGMWDVPYDDYISRLHKGEMVLTASQARRYRNGLNGEIDLSRLGDIVREAIKSGMEGVSVRSYLNGKDITEEVNRNTVRAIKARRFAT